MRRVLLVTKFLTIATALAVAIVPLPSAAIEQYYADAFYPALQAGLTSWSNETSVALFDFILVFLVAVTLALLFSMMRRLARERSLSGLARRALSLATFLAAVLLWFEFAWGLNYARVPLEAQIGVRPERVTAAAVQLLAERAVSETNAAYTPGHAAGFPEPHVIPPALVTAFHEVERRLGRPRATVPGRPKKTLMAPFFRASGTDGMHAPFMLETLLNPDLTPPERPAVLAHEWAHLAGYAPEDDASFVGLLAALRADPGARYSAWLTLTFETISQLPRAERQRLLERLDEGPKRDQAAIAARLASRVDVVQRVSWQTYDQYLKAQGVEEGVRSYSRVVELLIASDALDW